MEGGIKIEIWTIILPSFIFITFDYLKKNRNNLSHPYHFIRVIELMNNHSFTCITDFTFIFIFKNKIKNW